MVKGNKDKKSINQEHRPFSSIKTQSNQTQSNLQQSVYPVDVNIEEFYDYY